MSYPDNLSPLRQHALDVLQRARKQPIGTADRNDLRQLASGLRRLESSQNITKGSAPLNAVESAQ